ncbi:unnamed protein product [Gadus morhua 'NCC']
MILSKMTGNWGDFEVRELLALRALDEIHRHITGTVKDGPVLEKLARMHRERGYSRTKAQVMSKLKNLRRKFHQVNNYNGKTGRGRLDWTYFDLCQAIWGESSLCADPSVESGPLSDTDASSTRGESASNDQPALGGNVSATGCAEDGDMEVSGQVCLAGSGLLSETC